MSILNSCTRVGQIEELVMESDIKQMNWDGKKVKTGQQHLGNSAGMAHQIFLWLWDVNSEQLHKSGADGRIGNQSQVKQMNHNCNNSHCSVWQIALAWYSIYDKNILGGWDDKSKQFYKTNDGLQGW